MDANAGSNTRLIARLIEIMAATEWHVPAHAAAHTARRLCTHPAVRIAGEAGSDDGYSRKGEATRA